MYSATWEQLIYLPVSRIFNISPVEIFTKTCSVSLKTKPAVNLHGLEQLYCNTVLVQLTCVPKIFDTIVFVSCRRFVNKRELTHNYRKKKEAILKIPVKVTCKLYITSVQCTKPIKNSVTSKWHLNLRLLLWIR